MSMLNIKARLDSKSKKLTEAKADTQRLVDFAGADLANRFLDIKSKLKGRETDLYYWIKNKTVAELEQAIIAAENTKSNRQLTKDAVSEGAELVANTEHWKVYHITSFEAAQLYGRDTKWCITGINDWGDKYWNDYTNRGVSFYFLITKGKYDPRGDVSKIALAIYPDKQCEIFNQRDGQMSLNDIPYVDEITIPGIDLFSLEYDEYFCYACGCGLNDTDLWMGLDDNEYCEDCFHEYYFCCDECEDVFKLEDSNVTKDGRMICNLCLEELPVQEALHNHPKGYNMIEFSEKVGWDSSARDWARALINTLEDDSIRILDYYEDKNFCDFKVNQHGDIITYRVRPGGEITIRAQESYSVVDDFKLYESLWELTEAKADTQRLIDFAGEDLANRFLQIKNKLKAPENDLYYWIKNKTAEEFEQAIIEAEAYKSNRQLAKDARINGAKLVCETAHWKVYHITTFEASQQLGRDTQWCITGINDWGDRYWNEYTSQGINFYFLITKGTYDPRGTDSKFAIADYPEVITGDLDVSFDPGCEVYNQQDIKVPLRSVPYIDEIKIPGVELKDEMRRCSFCHTYCPDEAGLEHSGLIYCQECAEKYLYICANCGSVEYKDFEFIGTDKAKLCRDCASTAKKTTCPNGYMYEVSCETPDGLSTKELAGMADTSKETLERLADIYLSLSNSEKEYCYVNVVSSFTGEVLFPGWEEPNPKGCTMETLNTIKDRLIKFDDEMKDYR
jgi:hypothetical protein